MSAGRGGLLRRRALALVLLVSFSSGCATFFQPSLESLMRDGVALYEAGRYAESIVKFEAVIRRDATRWLAYLYLARSFLALADWLPAIANATKAVQLAPTDPQGYRVLARASFGSGDLAGAARALLDGFARSEGGRSELLNEMLDLGSQALGRGDGRTASQLLSRYVQENPRDLAALLQLGKAYWQAGETRDALETFGRVLQLSPSNAEALRYLQQGFPR